MHYLISILVSTSILVVYGIVLMIIEQYIGNYGECKISINKEKELTIEGGQSLLSGLIESEIFIPSACGGKGTCGYCKCAVKEGAGPILPTEKTILTKEDIAENKRLACQVKIKNDMEIEIPADMLNAQAYQTKITKIEEITYDIKLVEFELLSDEIVEFKPGQYMQFKIPDTDEFRAYSIASTPSDNKKIQFMIRQVPDGVCSTYIHQQLEVGDEITLTGPYGDFFLQEDSKKEIVCIAGGVGVPPLKSIILHLFDEGKVTDRKVTYYFGARSVKDLYFYDDPTEIDKKYSNFNFVPALSEPGPEDNWKGETGFIHLALEKRLKDGPNTEAYLCGPEPMIEAVQNVLIAKGVDPKDIYYDKF